jgi:hypothetical protein
MTRQEKENILELVTGWSPQLIKNLTDEEIDRVYRERVEARNEMFYQAKGEK